MLAFRPRRFLISLAVLMTTSVLGYAAERSEVPAQYKWDLTALFKSEADWTAAKEKLVADVPLIAKFEGRLAESPQTLLDGLGTYMRLGQSFERIYTYASQHFDEDTRVGRSQEMEQEADEVGQKLRTAASFVRPEIIALGKEKMEQYLAAEPRLAEYRPYLENLVRWAPHTLSADEEKLVAQAGRLAGAPSDIHGVFVNAEMPYPTVTLSDGQSVRLDAQGYTQYRVSGNREDRKKVFQAFWQAHQDFRRTLGTSLYGQVKNHIFTRNVRKFDSCLEAALYNDNIPTTVYRQLIADVHANLPTLHRYLKLRARMMGLTDLGYEDLYAPIVSEVNLTYTPEQAIDLTVSAVKPLGPEYAKVLGEGLTTGGWVDWIPTTGKRAGAYSTIAYGVHPYQLLNFTGNYDEVSTLAHESGHSMHSYLSSKHQPYVTYDYATFVAEVASTLNENLLFHSMLDKTKDDDTRLFLLGNYLENLRTTLFRQVLFAEFELAMHEAAERGEPLTGDGLNKLYLGLVRQYYGHAEGVCNVDELYGVEWAYINHFFYNFYVFQYATSLVASTAIANSIQDEAAQEMQSTRNRDAYLELLSSGGSKYPIDLLKAAGVDMTTPAPFSAAMREMNAVMDEMEGILAKRK